MHPRRNDFAEELDAAASSPEKSEPEPEPEPEPESDSGGDEPAGAVSGEKVRFSRKSRYAHLWPRGATVRPVQSERLYLPEEEESDGCAACKSSPR
jgi:hypothetical protein